jgi:3-methyladenine DNA glycosylase Mpg
LWVAGGAVKDLNPKKALKALRRHWEIENRLFWVRDVDFSEDRLHGRRIGPGLSVIRSVATKYRFVVDGFRALSARADRGLSLLIGLQP